MKEIIFVRHGECQSNATEMFQAGNQVTTDRLTKKGVQDARALAQRMQGLNVDLVTSSSYLRARQTAQIINEVVQAPHVVPVIENEKVLDVDPTDVELRYMVSLLREIDLPSELAGLTYTDKRAASVKKRMQQAHALRRKVLPLKSHFSDEENVYDLWQRASEITSYLESRPEKNIVVVAHGGILKVWLAHVLFGQEIDLTDALIRPSMLKAYSRFAHRVWWDNTGFISLRYDPDSGWQYPIANIDHRHPKFPNIMPQEKHVQTRQTSEEASEYLD